jgi:DNA-binding beta-propeller fold protein YncE
MMALDADAGRLYAGRSTLSSASTYGLGVFDAHTLKLEEEVPLPGFDIPHALALTADGRSLLTAPLTGRVALVVDAATGDLVSRVPLGDANRELVHFSLLPGDSTATLTSNSEGVSEALFFSLDDDRALTLDGAVPTGARAWHGHLDSDGRTLLVPNRAGNSATLIDVPTQTVRLTAENPAGGPLAMPHSPAPTIDGMFFVSNSNLQGTWAPPYRFLSDKPDGERGAREPLPPDAFGNVAVLDAQTGEVVGVILLGRYPSGLEHWQAGGHGVHDHGHGDIRH